MKLRIQDRLHLVNLLPAEGNFLTLSLKHDILKKVNLTQDEIEACELRVDGNQILWNTEKAFDCEIQFTDAETALIQSTLKDLDSNQKLTEQSFELYSLFI